MRTVIAQGSVVVIGALVHHTALLLFNFCLWKHGGAATGSVRRSRSEWFKGLTAGARRMSFADAPPWRVLQNHNLIYVEVMSSTGSSCLMTESGRNSKADPHLGDKMTPLMGSFGLRAGPSRTLATNLPPSFPSLRVRFAHGFISSELYPVLYHTDISSNKILEHLILFFHLLSEEPFDILYVIKVVFYG